MGKVVSFPLFVRSLENPIMTPELVVSDVDGCITDGKGKAVDAALLAELRTVIREHNIRIILCSGRVHPYLEAVGQQVGLEATDDPLIVQSGAALYFQRQDRLECLLTAEQRAAVDEARRRLQARVSGEQGWHLEAGRDLTVCVVPDPGGISIAELARIAQDELDDLAVDIHPSNGGVDILATGADKGTALRRVLDRLGVDPARTLGIGDSSGDLTFLSLVGMAGCPANATKPVRRLILSREGHDSAFETTEGVIDILRHYYAGGQRRTSIFGVSLRHPKTVQDERGRLTEWLNGSESTTYVSFYEIETAPGYLRANHYHPAGTKDELIRVTRGQYTVYLEDLREDSPTRGMRQEIVLRATEPHMLCVPSGVAHVLVNTGKDLASATVHSTEYYQPGHDVEHAVLPSAGYRPVGR